MKTEFSQNEKMKFAKILLLGLAVMYSFAAAAKIFISSERVNAVWDFTTYFIPGLITLIIGYFFGSKK